MSHLEFENALQSAVANDLKSLMNPYVQGLRPGRLSFINPHVQTLYNLTFGGYKSLRPGVKTLRPGVILTFWGYKTGVRSGVLNPYVQGYTTLRLGVIKPYVLGL